MHPWSRVSVCGVCVFVSVYLLFVCLLWLLPFGSRLFSLLFSRPHPDHIFFLPKTQTEQTVKTRNETRKRDLARKPSCDLVFICSPCCPPGLLSFSPATCNVLGALCVFSGASFWALHARLDTDAATKDTDTSALIPIVLLFLACRIGAERCLHVACLFVLLYWEDARKRSGPCPGLLRAQASALNCNLIIIRRA